MQNTATDVWTKNIFWTTDVWCSLWLCKIANSPLYGVPWTIIQPNEGGEHFYLAGEVVLVHENVFKTPHLEAVDMTKLALPVEVLPTVLPFVDKLLRKLAEQLHTLRKVIFIPIVVFSRPAIKIEMIRGARQQVVPQLPFIAHYVAKSDASSRSTPSY